MGNSKFLPVAPDRALNKSKETAERLNNVSDTIQEMAKTYKAQEKKQEKEKNQYNQIKKYLFQNYLII